MKIFTLAAVWICCLALLGGNSLYGQFETVEFDYQRAAFNNGQTLPAETFLMVTGEVRPHVELVEIKVFRSKASKKTRPLYLTDWKKDPDQNEKVFRAPFNYQLSGNSDYDFQLSYYRAVTEGEKNLLRTRLFESLDAYLAQSLTFKGTKVKVLKSASKMISDMNGLVLEALSNYRSRNYEEFTGFSNLIKEGLKSLDDIDLGNMPVLDYADLDSLGISDTTASNMPLPTDWYQRPLHALHKTIHVEVDHYLNSDLMLMIDRRVVNGYPTEKTRRSLALNVGYGGVLLGTDDSQLSYGTAPYVGLSLPLASRASANRFWTNTSLSLGVFTSNFNDGDGNKITGPIFGIPYYLGLGYRFFRFIRLNAGATLLEKDGTGVGGSNGSISIGEIKVKPFLGISAEFDLWIGFSERR